MRINAIKENSADVTLDASELVLVANLLHEHEKAAGRMKPAEHDFAVQVITARDLCQYGRLDAFAISRLAAHKIKSDPEKHAGTFRALLDVGPADPET